MSIWDDWLQQQQAKQKSEHTAAVKAKTPIIYRTITQAELKKLQRLCRITPQPRSMDKRFIRQFETATKETQITERQSAFIEILWYKYRRQLGHNDPRPAGYVTK